MPHLSLLPTILREVLGRQQAARIPEAAIMDDTSQVAAYAQAGRKDSVMSAAYLYHTARVCQAIQGCETVADMGCGPASQLAQIAELNPHIRFRGFDLSNGMVANGRRLAEQRRLDNLHIETGDITNLSMLADSSVDGVISTMTLHQFPDITTLEGCFAEAARILRPNGAVYIVDFGRLKYHKSMQRFVDIDRTNQPWAFNIDYENSLKAAFLESELMNLARRYLPAHAQVYRTFAAPILVAIKTADHPISRTLHEQLKQLRKALPRRYRRELDDIRLFFRLGGLGNDPFSDNAKLAPASEQG